MRSKHMDLFGVGTGKECDHNVRQGSRCGAKRLEAACFISDSPYSSWPMDHENESEILGCFFLFSPSSFSHFLHSQAIMNSWIPPFGG